MNLKDANKNLSDEEIGEILTELTIRLREGQKEPPTERHYYEFTGTWSWGTWATSREEAVECFKESCIEDIEILTDEYTIEQMD